MGVEVQNPNPLSAFQAASAAPTLTRKTLELTGAANLGEFANPNIPLFTVTGRVLMVSIAPFCTESLASAGGGTLALGVTGNTAAMIAATTATDIDSGDVWVDATPAVGAESLPAALGPVLVSANIVGTVGTADITDGTIEFDCLWLPMSAGASLVAA